MKKIMLIIILPMFILFILIGCAYKGYSGDYLDLYTVAINSVLWNNGHSFNADKYINPEIIIIDKDMYGRTMFMYYEKYYAGANISFSSLIISQNSNEKEVFYYEDINYIVKEQILYAQDFEEFEDEEIEQLKIANDWDQEINFDKCIKKEIIKSKPDIPNEQKIKNKIINEFDLVRGEYSLFMDFLTSDSRDSNFIIYGYIRINDKDGIYFIGLVESEKESFKEINLLIPSNVFDYKNEFIKFKQTHNWV